MEFLAEVLMEILGEVVGAAYEAGIEIGTDKKVKKYVRYPILGLVILVTAMVLFLIFFCGMHMLFENALAGALLLAVGIFLGIGIVFKIKKSYHKVKKHRNIPAKTGEDYDE